jgi:hypothetical protein
MASVARTGFGCDCFLTVARGRRAAPNSRSTPSSKSTTIDRGLVTIAADIQHSGPQAQWQNLSWSYC